MPAGADKAKLKVWPLPACALPMLAGLACLAHYHSTHSTRTQLQLPALLPAHLNLSSAHAILGRACRASPPTRLPALLPAPQVKVMLNLNGVVVVEHAQMIEEEEVRLDG